MKKTVLVYLVAVVLATLLSGASYALWNSADPSYTCAQCHKVEDSHARWSQSAHKDVACVECHAAALENGVGGVAEKLGMVFSHFSKDIKNSDIKMAESQVLEISERCASCHKSEAEKWASGKHSTLYKNIFEDVSYNSKEKPYADCFRCHGMFYDGDINTLMGFEGDCSHWKIKDRAQADIPAIPCLACHKIHSPADSAKKWGPGSGLSNPPKTSFYSRAERKHFRTDNLTPIEMYLGSKKLETSKDPNNTLCIQCHSPNWERQARSCDDRTPTGEHKGFSCIVCHDPHSNSAADSCARCHDISKPEYRAGKTCQK